MGSPVSSLNDPRVLFAAERTLLAWNRTSLSLVAFGFVLERAGLLLRVLQGGAAAEASPSVTPAFLLGLAFILFGGVCALVSAYQYAAVLKTLSPEEIPKGYSARWGLMVNVVLSVLSALLSFILYDMHG